jgi:putative endonuclease
MKGWVYILKCADDTYYTGSTNNILLRYHQHSLGIGSNYTAKRLPLVLLYLKEYSNVADAFYREKQIQGWSRRKKEALIRNDIESLKLFSICYQDFSDALKNKNLRFKKLDLSVIEDINIFLNDEILISEVLEFIAQNKK